MGSKYIHGSVGSVAGSFVISLLGDIYSALSDEYAYAAMVPGILLLVPSGLTAVGGLAQNGGDANETQFTNGLNTGLAMIQRKFFFFSFFSSLLCVFADGLLTHSIQQ